MRKRLRRALRRHGIAGIAKLVPKNAWFAVSYFAPRHRRNRRALYEFDRRFGVDTGGFRSASSFDMAPEVLAHANNYGAVQKIDVYLKQLHITFSEYIFIDYGCGKGRALLMASDFPFKQIIGVEYVADLVKIARRNIAIYGNPNQKCHDITVVEVNAVEFEPPAAPTVFFLYNPFDKVVLDEVLARIRNSQSRKMKRNYLIYCEPDHRSAIDNDREWEIAAEHSSWVLYRSPTGGEAG